MTRSESYTLPSAAIASAAPQPFSVMWIAFAFQSACTILGAQYNTSGPSSCQEENILGCDLLIGIAR
jgi:hypothetical protein